MKGFGRTSFIPGHVSGRACTGREYHHTVSEVHFDIVASNVGSHRDNGRMVELPDKVAC